MAVPADFGAAWRRREISKETVDRGRRIAYVEIRFEGFSGLHGCYGCDNGHCDYRDYRGDDETALRSRNFLCKKPSGVVSPGGLFLFVQ